MIFVAVGTQKFPMDRLLVRMDELIASGKITEPVFAQIGHTQYLPRNYEYRDFLDKRAFEDAIAQCDLLVTHSGVSTIMLGLSQKKPVVVVPRLVQYGEHVDDHQLEIAKAFSQKNYVALCAREDSLYNVITQARSHNFNTYHSQRAIMLNTIQNYLDSI